MPKQWRQSAAKSKPDCTLTIELAYLLGVFLGDGSVSFCERGKNYFFSLNAIDEEFVRKTARCLEKILNKKINVFLDRWPERRKRKPLWKVVAYSKDFCRWLNQITHHKNKIPRMIKKGNKEIKKIFALGLMDSDGYISETVSKHGLRRWRVGYCSADIWLPNFAKMLQSLGVKIGSIRKEQKIKPFHKQRLRFNINPESYVKSEIGFSIIRKKVKLNNYIKQVLTAQRLHA